VVGCVVAVLVVVVDRFVQGIVVKDKLLVEASVVEERTVEEVVEGIVAWAFVVEERTVQEVECTAVEEIVAWEVVEGIVAWAFVEEIVAWAFVEEIVAWAFVEGIVAFVEDIVDPYLVAAFVEGIAVVDIQSVDIVDWGNFGDIRVVEDSFFFFWMKINK